MNMIGNRSEYNVSVFVAFTLLITFIQTSYGTDNIKYMSNKKITLNGWQKHIVENTAFKNYDPKNYVTQQYVLYILQNIHNEDYWKAKTEKKKYKGTIIDLTEPSSITYWEEIELFFGDSPAHANEKNIMSYQQVVRGFQYMESLKIKRPNFSSYLLPKNDDISCKNYIAEVYDTFYLSGFLDYKKSDKSFSYAAILHERFQEMKKCENTSWYEQLLNNRIIFNEPIESHARRLLAKGFVPVSLEDVHDLYGLDKSLKIPQEFDYEKLKDDTLLLMFLIFNI